MNVQKPKSKYIIARIDIPIEVLPDGSHINHNDRSKVHFLRCNLLPPKQNHNDMDYQEILSNLLNTSSSITNMEEDEDEPVFMVKCEDINQGDEKTDNEDVDDDVVNDDDDVVNDDDDDEEEDVNDDEDEDDEHENSDDESEEKSEDDVFLTKEELQEYFVLKSEILSAPREPSKNTSFKKYTIHKKHNVTSKSRNKKSS